MNRFSHDVAHKSARFNKVLSQHRKTIPLENWSHTCLPVKSADCPKILKSTFIAFHLHHKEDILLTTTRIGPVSLT